MKLSFYCSMVFKKYGLINDDDGQPSSTINMTDESVATSNYAESFMEMLTTDDVEGTIILKSFQLHIIRVY